MLGMSAGPDVSAAGPDVSAGGAASPPRAIVERRVSARVGSISESTTLAIDARAKALKASGRPVIVFGAGEPDFPTPQHIVEAAQIACRDPRMHHYTPPAGLPELREAVAATTSKSSGREITPTQVVICNGGKQALYNSFAAILDPGDEVLLPAPYWTTYPESIRLAGGVPVVVPTDETSGYLASVEALEAACTERTRALVFVSPNNPTGACYDTAGARAIGEWAAERGLWVITDEIYEHLRYGAAADGPNPSIPALVPDIADRCIVVNGVAKTYAMTGWRVGWLIAPLDIAKATGNLMSHATSNVANVAQAAALAALTGPQDEVARMRAVFDQRRQTMTRMLREIDGMTCPEPMGAFYCFPAVRDLLGRPIGDAVAGSSAELAEILLDRAEVAVVPGEAFGAPGYLRLSYALGDDDLVEGISRIQTLLR
jgi:aspartate/methionine/tyrosine aminotransferase